MIKKEVIVELITGICLGRKTLENIVLFEIRLERDMFVPRLNIPQMIIPKNK